MSPRQNSFVDHILMPVLKFSFNYKKMVGITEIHKNKLFC